MIRPILGATALIAFAALPAFAVTEKFEMAIDINRDALETPQGAEIEFQHVKQDIHERCVAEQADATLPFSSNFGVSFCENRTMKEAVRVIDHPNFTAVYQAAKAN